MYRKDGQVNKRKLERDDPNDNKNFLSVSRNNGYETIQMNDSKTFKARKNKFPTILSIARKNKNVRSKIA